MRRRGNALVEVTLMVPWIFFLFVGVLDFGFYSYAMISVENAARVAALRMASDASSASDPSIARQYVCAELRNLPNAQFNAADSSCSSTAVVVTVPAQPFAGADGLAATEVAVTYTSMQMIPIPGLVDKQFTVTRLVQSRILQ